MIQRIQTAFLLVVTVLAVIIVIHPVSEMSLNDGTKAIFTSFSFKSISEPVQIYTYTFPIAVLAIVSAAISFITILLFQKRPVQMRLCVYNILITIGLAGVMFFYYFKIKNGKIDDTGLAVNVHSFTYTIIIPFIGMIY